MEIFDSVKARMPITAEGWKKWKLRIVWIVLGLAGCWLFYIIKFFPVLIVQLLGIGLTADGAALPPQKNNN